MGINFLGLKPDFERSDTFKPSSDMVSIFFNRRLMRHVFPFKNEHSAQPMGKWGSTVSGIKPDFRGSNIFKPSSSFNDMVSIFFDRRLTRLIQLVFPFENEHSELQMENWENTSAGQFKRNCSRPFFSLHRCQKKRNIVKQKGCVNSHNNISGKNKCTLP